MNLKYDLRNKKKNHQPSSLTRGRLGGVVPHPPPPGGALGSLRSCRCPLTAPGPRETAEGSGATYSPFSLFIRSLVHSFTPSSSAAETLSQAAPAGLGLCQALGVSPGAVGCSSRCSSPLRVTRGSGSLRAGRREPPPLLRAARSPEEVTTPASLAPPLPRFDQPARRRFQRCQEARTEDSMYPGLEQDLTHSRYVDTEWGLVADTKQIQSRFKGDTGTYSRR